MVDCACIVRLIFDDMIDKEDEIIDEWEMSEKVSDNLSRLIDTCNHVKSNQDGNGNGNNNGNDNSNKDDNGNGNVSGGVAVQNGSNVANSNDTNVNGMLPKNDAQDGENNVVRLVNGQALDSQLDKKKCKLTLPTLPKVPPLPPLYESKKFCGNE